MIIDAHFHTFPRLGTKSGGEDPQLNIDFLQYHLNLKGRFRRRADGVWVENVMSRFDSDDQRKMPNLNFRIANFGQVEFTYNGGDYYRQAWPPSLQDMSAPSEQMVAEMDLVGVDIGVLQHDHIYGSLNEYYGECMRRFPGRFIGLAQIREWEADQEIQHERLERAIKEQGLKGLYFSVEPFALNNFGDTLDNAKFEPLWNKVRMLKIPVWWYLHSRRRKRLEGFMEHVAELNRWAEKHPDIPAVLTHGIDTFSMRGGEERYKVPDEIMTLLKRPNMHVEILFHAFWPEYPYPGAQEMIKMLCEEIGFDKMMWGSDMPCTWMWCTYRQSMDYIRLHCNFLSKEEKNLILGSNAARMFKLQEVTS